MARRVQDLSLGSVDHAMSYSGIQQGRNLLGDEEQETLGDPALEVRDWWRVVGREPQHRPSMLADLESAVRVGLRLYLRYGGIELQANVGFIILLTQEDEILAAGLKRSVHTG